MITPIEHRASHVDAQWDDVLALLREHIRAAGHVRHLGHYTNGSNDLTIGSALEVGERKLYNRKGREFSLLVSDLEAELVPLRTGSLIRVVLQSREESAHCCAVVPDQHVVAFAVAGADCADVPLQEVRTVLATDRQLSDLATRLRLRLGERSQNPGGWLTERPVEASDASEDAPVEPCSPLRTTGRASSTVADLCRGAVGPARLHYVAWCEDNRLAYSVDDFEDPRMGRFFDQIEVSERRRLYRALCCRLPEIATQLHRVMSGAGVGLLDRIVLDVEQGAIYYYRVRPGTYVVGVTLDQSNVAQADAITARLVMALKSR